ncbi:ABC transporter permease [Haloimpatiens sp. FM7315]|uniref:ABC transporter permease n=1 Tax=Haloimpatiens sp. FM7315 TaxID=3298609 RepID=UPI0035A303FA
MFNIVTCEMKKFKRLWLWLIIGVFVVIKVSTLTLNTSVVKSVDDLFTWVNMTVFSYGFLMAINILTAYVFVLEYKNNTMLVMASYKSERFKIFLGKIIAVILISFVLYMIEFLILAGYGLMFYKSTVTSAVLMKHFLITLKSFVFQMLMISVTASISLVSRNIIAPIMYIGVQLALSFTFFVYPASRAFIPFALPVTSNLMLVRNTYKIIRDVSIMPSSVIIAVVLFASGLIFGCFYINKMEIN